MKLTVFIRGCFTETSKMAISNYPNTEVSIILTAAPERNITKQAEYTKCIR